MLSGSAIVRVSVLLVAAGLLAALAQFLWLRGDPAAEVPTVAAPPRERPVEAAPPSPAPVRDPPPAARAAPETPPDPQPAPSVRAAPQMPAQAAPQVPAPAARPPQDADADADPRAFALVDLNTATLAQLNALKGGGNIGRAIIQKRPYTAVDQLLARRVLSRGTYERIKDQVTVQ